MIWGVLDTLLSSAGVVLAAWIAQRTHRTGRKADEFYDRWSSNGD